MAVLAYQHAKDEERMVAPDELICWFEPLLEDFGRKPYLDWNVIEPKLSPYLRELKNLGKDADREFRRHFILTDPKAEPVILKSEPLKQGGKVSEADRFAGWFPGPDDGGKPVRVRYVVDTQLRDFENIPIQQDIDDYFRAEVLPHVPDAWMDRSKDKIGYEINFNRHFYRYTPPRPLETIDKELKKAEDEILRLLNQLTN
jgi:type I restriction enzyme M protein